MPPLGPSGPGAAAWRNGSIPGLGMEFRRRARALGVVERAHPFATQPTYRLHMWRGTRAQVARRSRTCGRSQRWHVARRQRARPHSDGSPQPIPAEPRPARVTAIGAGTAANRRAASAPRRPSRCANVGERTRPRERGPRRQLAPRRRPDPLRPAATCQKRRKPRLPAGLGTLRRVVAVWGKTPEWARQDSNLPRSARAILIAAADLLRATASAMEAHDEQQDERPE